MYEKYRSHIMEQLLRFTDAMMNGTVIVACISDFEVHAESRKSRSVNQGQGI